MAIDKKSSLQKKENITINHVMKKKRSLSATIPFKEYEVILREIQLIAWINKLKKELVFSFVIKTDDANSVTANILGISFAVNPGVVAYIPFSHDYSYIPSQLGNERILELLKPIMEDSNILKIGKNLKQNYSVLRNSGIELRGIAFDVMIESYVLDSVAKCYDIDSLSSRWLKQKTISPKEVGNNRKNQFSVNNVICWEMARCFAEEADTVLRLHLKLWPKIKKNKELFYIFKYVDMPLVSVLSRIECNGVKIDPIILHNLSQEFTLRLYELKKKHTVLQKKNLIPHPLNS